MNNPYDNTELAAEVHAAGEEDVALAVSYAEAAFKTGPWSTYTGAQRAAPMLKLADLIDAHTRELAELDAIAMGGPVGAMGAMIGAAAATFRCEFLQCVPGMKIVLICPRLRGMGG